MVGLENYYKLVHDPARQAIYDDIWVVMLYSPKGRPANFHHVKALAPSQELYQNFQVMKDMGEWNLNNFQALYAPRYMSGIMSNGYSRSQLECLIQLACAGRNIAIVCTCYHEDLCHRSILGGIVQATCPGVVVDCLGDYSHYWHELNSM